MAAQYVGPALIGGASAFANPLVLLGAAFAADLGAPAQANVAIYGISAAAGGLSTLLISWLAGWPIIQSMLIGAASAAGTTFVVANVF